MHELVGIAAVPGQGQKYSSQLYEYYREQAVKAVPEHYREEKKKRSLDDWKMASSQMMHAMKLKKKLEYRG